MRIFWSFAFLAGLLAAGLVTAANRQTQPPIPPKIPSQLPTNQTAWGYIVGVLHTNVAYHSLTINGVTVTNDITLITVNTFYELGFRNDHVVVWREVTATK